LRKEVIDVLEDYYFGRKGFTGVGKPEGEGGGKAQKVEGREKLSRAGKKGRGVRGKQTPKALNINAVVASNKILKLQRQKTLRGNTKIICHSPSFIRNKSPDFASESASLSMPPRSQASPGRRHINFDKTPLASSARSRTNKSISNNGKGGFSSMVEKYSGPFEIFPVKNLQSLGEIPDLSSLTEGLKILDHSPRSNRSYRKTKSLSKSNTVQAKNPSRPAGT
jgi:hypothetical protein